MEKTKFVGIFTFATLLYLLFLGYLGSQLFAFYNREAKSLSQKMLSQSQKIPDFKHKIIMAKYSDILDKNDLAKFEMAKGYFGLGKASAAQEALIVIENSELYEDFALLNLDNKKVSDKKSYVYWWFKNNGFPQVAHKYILDNNKSFTSRDQLLWLADEYKIDKKYEMAAVSIEKARSMDQYYPQAYEHFLSICEYLPSERCQEYKKLYENITW